MDFSELIEKRRAAHNFLPNQKISDEQILEIIQKTTLTPSGYNAQPWEFIAIKEKSTMHLLQECAFQQPHLQNASAAIIILADTKIDRHSEKIIQEWIDFGYLTTDQIPYFRNSFTKKRSPEKLTQMAIRNAMLASMTLIFAAENLGLSTCPLMGFDQKLLRKKFLIPDEFEIALIVALGYNDTSKEKPRLPRKNISEILHQEKFGAKNQ